MPTRTDVQTDVHIVPVDSDSPTRKLAVTLIYQCKWCICRAMTACRVHQSSCNHTHITLICKHLTCLQIHGDEQNEDH